MESNFKARELALMTLPVLILGGAAFWRSSHFDISSKLGLLDASKPLHIAYSSFEPAELSPFEVARGYIGTSSITGMEYHDLAKPTNVWPAKVGDGFIRALHYARRPS
ncbi:MAG: hypothetical protein EOO38_31140 [Cytophagaceae bacterium]|nr:MAG: hypothetical protein EOO38_31140 [Cytophagaceae bacterium]